MKIISPHPSLVKAGNTCIPLWKRGIQGDFQMKIALFIVLLLFLPVPCIAHPSAEEVLEKADEVRSPQLDYKVFVEVTSIRPGKEPKKAKYEVLIKGKDKTIIKTLEPRMDRGTSLLMIDYDLWVFLQNISKPLRISLQQRLIGEVANGDIARANFSGDYIPKILKIESIAQKDYYVLELLAKDERVTYHKVILWIQKDSFHPFKAEFYAVSGRILKMCSYENYQQVLGRLRPTRLVLDDPLVRGQKSILEYSDMTLTQLPEKYFTKDYLKKLKY
ncbi:MAG: outer membrane lipoprotein-sorting protein [Thermodesulfobacteriota bacterium]|nr:outer membrane lipoprotein-sorting protein [Thermodesulfobacteriota bacterium]